MKEEYDNKIKSLEEIYEKIKKMKKILKKN